MNKRRHIKKSKMLTALEQSLGVVTTACKKADIPRSTFYKWYNEDESFREDVNELANITIDFAESQLLSQIKGGNTTATIFYLKTKGKGRGYVERQEVEHSGEIKEVKVNISKTRKEDE